MVTKKYGSISGLICSTLRSFEKNDQLLSGSFIKNFPIRMHGTVVGDPSSITLQVFPPKLFFNAKAAEDKSLTVNALTKVMVRTIIITNVLCFL